MKLKKTYRIEEELIDKLDKYAQKHNITSLKAVAIAIESLKLCQTDMSDKNTNSHTLAILEKQLETKDKQIENLTAALVLAQKSVEQAHVLHASDKPALLETQEQKQKRSFWSRLFK